jgi:hypothetical protein
LRTLPEDAWSRYLAGDDKNAGEGARLLQGSDPMIALTLWRQRPAYLHGEIPLFVIQALAETGEWDDPVAEESLGAMEVREGSPASRDRLYWLTRLQLLRGKPLGDVLRKKLVAEEDEDDPREFMALQAVAAAFEGKKLLHGDFFDGDNLSISDTRSCLVWSRWNRAVRGRTSLDEVVTVQRDWSQLVHQSHFIKATFGELMTQRFQETRERREDEFQPGLILSAWYDAFRVAFRKRKLDIGRRGTQRTAQKKLNALHGAPLDAVTRTLRELQREVRVNIAGKSAEARSLLLRGMTQEFHRPVRQALREALTAREQIQGMMERFRPALSICPADLEPEAFVERALHDPANWFLSLAQFADRARSMEALLEAARAQAPGNDKLQRVHEAWLRWDRAICDGASSDWRVAGK